MLGLPLGSPPLPSLLQLAPQAWLPRHATDHNLRSVLVQMHLLTTVLCGSVQAMLDQVGALSFLCCEWEVRRLVGLEGLAAHTLP